MQDTSSYNQWLAKSYVKEMASQHTVQALSWRRLYLARAKLKATSRTSALLSGFAMGISTSCVIVENCGMLPDVLTTFGNDWLRSGKVITGHALENRLELQPVGVSVQVAMVEIQLEENIPDGLLIAFSICTTLVVAVHLLALMISTCILPNIEAVSNIHNLAAVQESPHDRMRCYVEMAWISSTGVGILLFLIQMAILAWVRFQSHSQIAPIVSTVIIIPALIVFVVFAINFYRQLVAHKVERSTKGLQEIETMANELDVGLRGSTNNIETI